MLSRICLTALLVLGSIFPALAGPHPSLPAPVIPDCLGVNIHFTKPQPGEMEMLAKAGFKWVRMDLTWAATERKRGEYDFSAYDGLVAELDKHKIRALFILDYGNPLYADPGDKQPFTSRAHTPEFREAFAKWAVAAVKHFAGRGYLWELWNEPNIEQFWKSQNGREDYVALAKTTGEALRAAKLLGPKEEAFIGPATSAIDLPFLEACFKAGLLEYWDAVSVHPYRQSAAETVEEDYRSVRELISSHAPKDKTVPIISGEWGYSSVWKDYDEERQALYVPRQFLTNLANDIALSIWYGWRDDGEDPKNAEHHFGLVGHTYHAGRDPVYDPKPAYRAVKVLTEQLGGFTYNKDITVVTPTYYGGYLLDNPVLLFTRGAETRLAVWRGGKGDKHVSIGASPGKFTVNQAYGAPRILESVAGKGLRLEADWDVQYLTPEKNNPLLQVAAAWKRLPLETVQHAPASIDIPDELTNPLDVVITLPGWQNPGEVDRASIGFAPPSVFPAEEVAARMAEARNAGEAFLSPKARLQRVVSQDLERKEAGYGRRLDVVDAGGPVSFFQHSQLRPLNALQLVLLPPSRDFLPVLVRNHGGEPMDGTIAYEFDGGDYTESIASGACVLRRGESEKIVQLKLAKDPRRISGNSLSFSARSGRVEFSSTAPAPLAVTLPKARLIPGGDPAIGSKLELDQSRDLPPSDTETVRVRYHFDPGSKFLRLVTAEDVSLFAQDFHASHLGMWIRGDGKGCQARIRFTDSTGQTFQTDGPKIDWQGWRFVTFSIKATESRGLSWWGGAGDGMIHDLIKLDTLLLLDNTSRQKIDGEILISAPSLIRSGKE